MAKNQVTPQYPVSKQQSGESATVSLQLTIDPTGAVVDVTVASSGGVEFDDAAIDAARQLTFSPAMRNGAPVTARIPFTFQFAYAKPQALAQPAKLASAALTGKVLTPHGDPLPGAQITATREGAPLLRATSDSDGTFRFEELAEGVYRVAVQAEGFQAYSADEELTRGTVVEATYRPTLLAVDVSGAQELDVVGVRPAREVTRRVLAAREIQKMPGTNGDALRSLESMPGVARSPGLTTQMVVRGAGPNDTAVFVDGTSIPVAYHFGGLTSVIPSEALSRIDFTPGNFSAEYGGAMGGIIDVGLRSPRKDRWGGLAQVDLLDGRVLAEGPLGQKTRLLVAMRRSWVDAWLGPLLKSSGAVGVSTAPVYYDGQVVLEHDLASHTTGRLAFIGSDDRLALTFASPQGSDPVTGFGTTMRFMRLQARTDTRIADGVRWVNTLAYGYSREQTDFGQNFVDVALYPASLRSDLRMRMSEAVTVITGFDGSAITYDASVKAPPVPMDMQVTGPYFARPAHLLTASGTAYRPAGYGIVELTPVTGVKLLTSVRADYASEIKELTVSPRFSTRVDLHGGYPRTTLKGGVGYFRQAPQPVESVAPFGTPTLKSNLATHTSLGIEQELSPQVELSVEGFYKKLDHLVVQRAAAADSESGVDYSNSGTGRVYGAEMLLRYRPDDRFFGWVAYTLSKSERRDGNEQAYHVFEYDQTHILTVLGSYQLGRGWELGGRFRYVTGNPYTPALSGVLDADAGAYAPVNAASFSGRSPAFHRLDVRIEKKWTFESWKLSAYLDLQNAYNRRNAEGRSYNFNYTRSDIAAGLPLLPVIGLRGEL